MADTIYKLPLDENTDNDLITWINSIPRSKKAEVVRHALRFYKSHLKEGEVFIMPSLPPVQELGSSEQNDIPVEKKSKEKKRPPAGLLTNITKTDK